MNIFQQGTLLLEEADIIQIIKNSGLENFLQKLREELESGFRAFAQKQITVPPRAEFFFPKGTMESMPAADDKYFACKIVNTHLENPFTFNLPTIIACGVLVDGQTGYPMLLTESTILTALRTGTASAIATKYLSRKDSNSIGLIGNGAQSIPQLHAISLVRDIKTVYAYDTDKSATESFKKTVEKLLGVEVRITDEEIASRQSDIIVTVTCKERNTPPVVYNKWVPNGTHINAVGGDSPNKVELEKSLVERAKLVVDFRDQAVYEGEAQQVPNDKIYADLAEIVSNNMERSDNEVTIFDSVGFAMEDLVTYKMIYHLATEQKIGKRVNIASRPKFIKNLYESYFVETQ